MKPSKWYGVRTIYQHPDRSRGRDRLYEERIVLIRAGSSNEAVSKAEEEAKAYEEAGSKYLGYSLCFEMFEAPGDGKEVFSLMRDSRLEPKRYLDVFFDTGTERSHPLESD